MADQTDNPLDGRGAPDAAGRAATPDVALRELLRASRRALSAMEGIADGMRDAGMSTQVLSSEVERLRAAIAAAEGR